ncbi:MAG: CDP-glycerol glycerophosphotransferase family protein [Lachnospiraceae bacterium]|nr:CDP-glycerol glycerophosphotransferase family protein [Lachnospiraceae bacterium]
MRRCQKLQMLLDISGLHMIHQQNKGKLLQKEYQSILDALADCQRIAIEIGESIEQTEGEDKEIDAVRFLEQYCETLYQVSLQLEEISAEDLYGTLEEALRFVEEAIVVMPVRKEIVFLPYKASMWDSLESVYFAAARDENCDAYVVPIPYYDRKADGGLGEMHYEGGEYPKNIPITHYEEYHLEERHPDAIYIHNPYDGNNYVTCVPERYFASRLRNYTDQLVYIPYFVLDEIKPDDHEKIEKFKNLCLMPGVIYAHKVIVQSENMRQIYINEFLKNAEWLTDYMGYFDRKKLEDKILALGSPKFDRVRNTNRDTLEVPDEWLRLIEKPDGTWKKIILYNTSVNAFFQYNEKMITKIKSVFVKFKEAQENAVLLWRPHPLISGTLRTLRPQLLAEYEQLVEEYRKEGYGIYDDTADVDRAIVLSDAYFGDYSSLVQLYQATGKPVMIEDVEVL